jgi:ABC-type lipoprotein release transport system permease subunit
MRKIISIAWRNVWRNRVRSFVVIGAIAMGVWAGLFVMALSLGMNNHRTEQVINTYVSHAQIHHPNYAMEQEPRFYVEYSDEISNHLLSDSRVDAFSARTLANGMVSSAAGGFGATIIGVDTSDESRVTFIHDKVVEGEYLGGLKRNPILIGEKLAEKMKVGLRSRLVVSIQNMDGEMTSVLFRVAGIYRSGNTGYDESHVFVLRDDLQTAIGSPVIHEFGIMAESMDESQAIVDDLNAAFPVSKSETWAQISPELGYSSEVMEQSLYIIMAIILLALAFGIVNTMLMAVLERKKELGMLMAIGMNRLRVFAMIMIETIFFGLVGGPVGVVLSYFIIAYFAEAGIDISSVGEGLESIGMATVLKPELPFDYFVNVTVMVIITAMLAAIYPAVKALRLKPVEAIRSV